MHLKAQVVVLFGKRLDERFARADNLCICRADPQHVRVAGRQKRLDLIIVIPRYNVGGKLQQSLCSHSAPRKKTSYLSKNKLYLLKYIATPC